MIPKQMDVQIANATVRVPVYKSPEETTALAARVSERVREFEAASTRVNTQVFALQTAYTFAMELLELREEIAEREGQIVERIQRVAVDIEKLRDEIDEGQ